MSKQGDIYCPLTQIGQSIDLTIQIQQNATTYSLVVVVIHTFIGASDEMYGTKAAGQRRLRQGILGNGIVTLRP